jgi:hypothetical protein
VPGLPARGGGANRRRLKDWTWRRPFSIVKAMTSNRQTYHDHREPERRHQGSAR